MSPSRPFILRPVATSLLMAAILLAGFVGYQMYRYTLSHSLVMIGLSAFDVIVIALVWREYRQLQRARGG